MIPLLLYIKFSIKYKGNVHKKYNKQPVITQKEGISVMFTLGSFLKISISDKIAIIVIEKFCRKYSLLS